MQKEIECTITGTVQMVLFRDFTKQNADMLGLYGTVENLRDGSVRVVAQGEEEKLKEFIEMLKIGPQHAKVEQVNIVWKEAKEELEDFKIIY